MSTETVGPEVVHPYVERRANVQGGRPVIRNSRFPVSSIVQNHRRGLTVEEMLREFPQLTPAEIYDALSYYHDHRAPLDQEIMELCDLAQSLRTYPPTISQSPDGGR